VTRPLEEELAQLCTKIPSGEKVVPLGDNGIGKSFVLDCVVRAGSPTNAEYRIQNDTVAPLEAISDEVEEKKASMGGAGAEKFDSRVWIKRLGQCEKDGGCVVESDCFSAKGVLLDNSPGSLRRKAKEANILVNDLCVNNTQ
jgi:hypothetical protein